MPGIMGISDDSYLGVYWYNEPNKPINMNTFRSWRLMFEQNANAVKRMRPKIDQFRERLSDGWG